MSYNDAASSMLGPVDSRRLLLANSGTTESVNAKALTPRVFITVLVGDVPVRMHLAREGGLAAAVGATDVLLTANGRFDFICEQESQFVYVEAADGIAAYQVWVWESSIIC